MKNRKRIVFTLLGVAAAGLIVWQFNHSPEWRNFSWARVWTATTEAQGWWIAGSVILIYASYLIRAFRWQILMAPNGRFWPVLKGTVIGFTSTALLGRAGELVRPYYIARKHGQELPHQLAVWLLERTFDMTAVVLVVAMDLGLSTQLSALTKDASYQHAFHRAGELLIIGILIVLGLMYWFYLRSAGILRRLQDKNRTRPSKIRLRYTGFLETLAEGMGGLARGRTMLLAIFYSAVLWVDIAGSIWMVVRAYPSMLPEFPFTFGILLMGLTAVGSIVQLPAVGGGFQVLTIFGLTQIFGAPTEAATSAALIVWLVCFYAIAPVGASLATHEGISWRGLEQESIAAERRAEAGD